MRVGRSVLAATAAAKRSMVVSVSVEGGAAGGAT